MFRFGDFIGSRALIIFGGACLWAGTAVAANPAFDCGKAAPGSMEEMICTTVKHTVPAAFRASETFDAGVDLGSPVSQDYFDRRPFQFNGKIVKVRVDLR